MEEGRRQEDSKRKEKRRERRWDGKGRRKGKESGTHTKWRRKHRSGPAGRGQQVDEPNTWVSRHPAACVGGDPGLGRWAAVAVSTTLKESTEEKRQEGKKKRTRESRRKRKKERKEARKEESQRRIPAPGRNTKALVHKGGTTHACHGALHSQSRRMWKSRDGETCQDVEKSQREERRGGWS